MRWLLLKDLQILRRSPLLVGLLVVYPVVISLLIGIALSRGPEKPKIAFVNEVPEFQQTITVGGDRIDIAGYSDVLLERVDAVPARTRDEALQMVEDGDVLGALVIPEDAARKLQSAVALGGSADKPTVEVIYDASGPLQGQLVQSLIDSTLAEANVAIGERLTEVAAGYLNILLEGGSFSLLGQDLDILGLSDAEEILGAPAPRSCPRTRPSAGSWSASAASPSWRWRTSTSPTRSCPRSATRSTSRKPRWAGAAVRPSSRSRWRRPSSSR